MDMTIITGLASLCGCLAMFFVCAAQVQALLAPRAAASTAHPWESNTPVQYARPARNTRHTTRRARAFALPDAGLAPSRL